MGNCLGKKKSKNEQKYRPSNQLDDYEISSRISVDSRKEGQKSVIKIKQNPKTSKLQGVPRKWVDQGYCNPKIVEMDKVVDVEMPLEQTDLIDIPDVVANYLDNHHSIIDIQGSIATDSSLSMSIQGMKLDQNQPYGIKNIPENWVQRLKASGIMDTNKNQDSQIILDLIRSQSIVQKDLPPVKSLMSAQDFIKAVNLVQILYENANDEYNIVKQLGKGAACRVFEARSKNYLPGQINRFAIRVMKNKKPSDLVRIQEQIALMKLCQCSNIVKHIETYYFKQAVYMVIEYMDAGSLTSLINRKQQIPERCMAYIMRQIIKGLLVLHQKKQIHRDLKSDNILLSENGDVKIADFGFAVQLTLERQMRNSTVGTPAWMAPQLIRKQNYNQKVDIWSLGIILLQMCSKQPPYLYLAPLKAMYMIASKDPPQVPDKHSTNLKNFYQKCCQKASQDRASCKQLLMHPFIRSIDSDPNIKKQFSNFVKKAH